MTLDQNRTDREHRKGQKQIYNTIILPITKRFFQISRKRLNTLGQLSIYL